MPRPLTRWGTQWPFLLVSSISCQHGSLRRADAEVGEKCSRSRLLTEPFRDGPYLRQPSRRMLSPLVRGPSGTRGPELSCSTGLSSYLPAGASGCPANSPLEGAAHWKAGARGPTPPPANSLMQTEQGNSTGRSTVWQESGQYSLPVTRAWSAGAAHSSAGSDSRRARPVPSTVLSAPESPFLCNPIVIISRSKMRKPSADTSK